MKSSIYRIPKSAKLCARHPMCYSVTPVVLSPGVSLAPKENHFPMSEDSFGCHTLGILLVYGG